jgi:hypothetical protein
MSGLLCMPVEANYHGWQPFASMPWRSPNALKRIQEIISPLKIGGHGRRRPRKSGILASTQGRRNWQPVDGAFHNVRIADRCLAGGERSGGGTVFRISREPRSKLPRPS